MNKKEFDHEIKEKLNNITSTYSDFFLEVVKNFNRQISQGDQLNLSNKEFAYVGYKFTANATAVGTNTVNGRKVIVSEVDGLIKVKQKNIKINGVYYQDIKTGLFIYSSIKTSKIEIKDGLFVEFIEEEKLDILREGKTEAKNFGDESTENNNVSIKGLKKEKKMFRVRV